MENNNTKDVAYLGCYEGSLIKIFANKLKTQSMLNCPQQWDEKKVGENMLFDCNGTRYGFRIKTLKTK